MKHICESCEAQVTLNDSYCPSCGDQFLNDESFLEKGFKKYLSKSDASKALKEFVALVVKAGAAVKKEGADTLFISKEGNKIGSVFVDGSGSKYFLYGMVGSKQFDIGSREKLNAYINAIKAKI